MRYSNGFKKSAMQKLQESGQSINQVAKSIGISPVTLSGWIHQFQHGTIQNDGDALTPNQRSPVEKLALLLEGRSLPNEELGEWLRKHGLHSEHLSLWEQELTYYMTDKQTQIIETNKALVKENKRLQAINKRQEKALAEAAILLTLKKNYLHLFEYPTESDVEK